MITMKELEERVAAKGEMTAAELDKLLHSCPEWVEREQKREAELAEKRRLGAIEEAPLLADLRRVGYAAQSVWDFVNSSQSYPQAIPVLLEHMHRPYSLRIHEGILRSLAVVEARGEPAATLVFDALKAATGKHRDIRWAMANALAMIADDRHGEALIQLSGDPDYADVSRTLKVAGVKAAKRRPST
jgi:hypothetical protein